MWKDIRDYEGIYKVNYLGLVKNAKTDSVLSSNTTKSGLRRVYLIKDGLKQHLFVHHLVFTHFVGEIPEGYYIRFKDDNPLNCRVENLYIEKGKLKSPNIETRRRVLPREVKLQILEEFKKGTSAKEVSDKYSISETMSYKIKSGQVWVKFKEDEGYE